MTFPTNPNKKKTTIPVVTRLLRALSTIYEGEDASVAEKLQALQLSINVLPLRKVPRRKTDKERALIAALGGKKKGEGNKPPPTVQTED